MIYLSIINHNHDSLIVENKYLIEIAKIHTVVIKSNTSATSRLKVFAKENDVILIDGDYGLGFGANNNFVFRYITKNLDMQENDFFLVINPDVVITPLAINTLIKHVKENKTPISTINLYRDQSFTEYDQSIKRFPSILTPLKAKLFKKREDIYNKDEIDTPTKIDWAAGSFLLFKPSIYRELNGFNEKFFMYFEDVDLAKRAKSKDIEITYYPTVKAIHFASYHNRQLFSKNFLFYLISFLRYHWEY